MAPPFSSDDEEDDYGGDDDDAKSPTGRSRRSLPSSPPTSSFPPRNLSTPGSSYEDNVLANSELLHGSTRTGSRKTSGPKGFIRASQTDGENDDDEEYSNRQQKINKVIVEIPLVLTMPEGKQDDETASSATGSRTLPQLQLSQNAQFSLQCHVPPSNPEGKWTGDIYGNSKVNHLVGSTNGSAQVTYKYNSRMRFLGGLDMLSTANHTRPFQLRLGGQYQESSTSMAQLALQQQEENHWGIQLSTRDVVDPWILNSTLWWHVRKGQWRSTLAATSMTTHRVRFLIGMKNWDPIYTTEPVPTTTTTTTTTWYLPLSTWQIDLDPKLSSTRRLPMILQYYPGKGLWNVSVALHTSKSTPGKSKKKKQQPKAIPSSWQVGLRGGATLASGWSILLAWTHGDITLRIPILLSTTLVMAKKGAHENKLVAAATPLLVLAISGVAQELLARFLWGNTVPTSSAADTASTTNTTRNPSDAIPKAKARQDAQSQQDLMKRQAENRKAVEAEKNGLVIQSATYQWEDISWDVTIPLQFWVSTDTSTLILAAESKQHLLGFYSLTDSKEKQAGSSNKSPAENNTAQTKKAASSIPWWKEFWTPTTQRSVQPQTSKDSKAAKQADPTLTILFTFQGKSYKATIRDQDSLQLPHKSESRNESQTNKK